MGLISALKSKARRSSRGVLQVARKPSKKYMSCAQQSIKENFWWEYLRNINYLCIGLYENIYVKEIDFKYLSKEFSWKL